MIHPNKCYASKIKAVFGHPSNSCECEISENIGKISSELHPLGLEKKKLTGI